MIPILEPGYIVHGTVKCYKIPPKIKRDMKTTLSEIKEQYAKNLGLNDWNHYRKSYGDTNMEGAMNQIAERFANAKAKALLEEAAEKMYVLACEYDITDREGAIIVDALDTAREITLSLIPKDTTKD